jgi:hypothetical protein
MHPEAVLQDVDYTSVRMVGRSYKGYGEARRLCMSERHQVKFALHDASNRGWQFCAYFDKAFRQRGTCFPHPERRQRFLRSGESADSETRVNCT